MMNKEKTSVYLNNKCIFFKQGSSNSYVRMNSTPLILTPKQNEEQQASQPDGYLALHSFENGWVITLYMTKKNPTGTNIIATQSYERPY